MTLLDTNIVVDAFDRASVFHEWAREQIASSVTLEGCAINAVTLAELSAGQRDSGTIAGDVRNAGIEILDIPAAAASVCGVAYRRYRQARKASGGGDAPGMPLPDFFIGAQAEVMGWKLATRDGQRFKAYFPSVVLIEP